MKKERNFSSLFFGIMLIAFLALLSLKCCGVIGWSWLWVTAPLWVIGVMVFAFIVLYCVIISKSWDRKSEE